MLAISKSRRPRHPKQTGGGWTKFVAMVMAKLGSFDDLPPNAQGFLLSYRARLERMSEAESKVVTVREV